MDKFQEVSPGDYYIYGFDTTSQQEDLLNQFASTADTYVINRNLISKGQETGESQFGLTADGMNSVIIMPFKDFTGEVKGYVKIVRSREGVVTELNNNRRNFIIISLFGIAVVLLLVYFVISFAFRPIVRLSNLADSIADGDLTNEMNINYTSQDEIGNLIGAFQRMLSNLVEIMNKLQSSALELTTHSQELVASNQQLTASAEEVSGIANEVAATSTQSLDNAEIAATESQKMYDVAKEGHQNVNETLKKINLIASNSNNVANVIGNLGERSDQIGNIVSTITTIADQTNLLALNAAIEAARAGEHGRGFAVVAEEVRKLAEQSSAAADEVTDLIKEIQTGVTNAVRAVEISNKETEDGVAVASLAGQSLENIISGVENVSNMMKDIAVGANQSRAGIDQVTGSTEEIAASAQQISGAAQELANVAVQLENITAMFKLKNSI